MLESCDPNFVLSPVLLAHMMLDRPGIAWDFLVVDVAPLR